MFNFYLAGLQERPSVSIVNNHPILNGKIIYLIQEFGLL